MKTIRGKRIIGAMMGLGLLAAMPGASALDLTADIGKLYLGPQIGIQKSNNSDHANLWGGAALRVKLLPALGAEASVDYRQDKFYNGAVNIKSWPIQVTGLLYPLPIVYGAIGAGWYVTTFDYNQAIYPQLKDDTRQRFGWHFGVGGELPLAIAKLTADVRYVFLDYAFKQVPELSGLQWDFFVISASFLFAL
jgi:hypothetical protein